MTSDIWYKMARKLGSV